MKWENRHINVEEWANTPKFSKLDHIVTPPRFLELFIDDILINMIVTNIKLYSHREKADISLKLLMKKITYC